MPYTHAPNKGGFCQENPWPLHGWFLNLDVVKVQIFVADLNDNAPRFEKVLYEASVPENIDVSQEIMTVKADDLDSRELHYP